MTLLGDAYVRIRPNADGFEGETKKSVTGAMTKVAGAAAGILAAAGLGKALSDAFDAKALNTKLQAQLGLTAQEAAKAGKVAGGLYRDNFGADLGQVNDAVRKVVQDIGVEMNAVDFKPISGKVLTLADTFDQDLGGITRAVGQMMKTGMAKDATEALDIISAGFQNGADKSEDFLDTLNEYGTQFRKLGIDGKTATGLISQGLKAGARDGDVVADALKEFAIRAIDGSDTTTAAYKSLGLSARDFTKDIAAGGTSAERGLDTVLDRLRAVKDPAERAAIATGLFGTQSEDLGDALFALDLDTASSGLGNVAGAADGVVSAMGSSPSAIIEGYKRTLLGLGSDLVGKAIPAFDNLFGVLHDKLGPVLGTVKDAATQAFDILFKGDYNSGPLGDESSGFIDVLFKIRDAFFTVKTFITDTYVPAMRQIADFVVSTFTPTFRALGDYFQEHLLPGFQRIYDAVQKNLPAFQGFGEFVVKASLVIEGLALKISGFLLPIAVKLAGFFVDNMVRAVVAVVEIVAELIRVFQDTWATMQNLARIIGEAWATIKEFFATGAEAIRSVVKTAVLAVVDFFLDMAERVLGAADAAFGWIGPIGDKLDDAKASFRKFRDGVNDELGGINNKEVIITAVTRGASNLGSEEALAHGSGTSRDRWRGGSVWGKGTGTSDSIPAYLSNGEHVWTAREVRAAGGHAAVAAMRSGVLNKYKDGGPVAFDVKTDADPAPIGRVAADHVAKTAEAFRKTQQAAMDKAKAAAGGNGIAGQGSDAIKSFIRSVDPLPYIWGAVGPNGYDCSGLVGEVLNRMIGRRSFSRAFTTASIRAGQYGLKPGLGGTLNIGVTPGSGHMAGSYGGLGFEARSTKTGIFTGSAAKSPASFARTFHLANGGPVEEWNKMAQKLDVFGDPADFHTKYDAGGMLEPGLTTAYNATGKPEPVFTADQWDILKGNLAHGTASGGEFTGNLTLDSGEFLGVVSGVVERRTNAIATSIRHGRR